MFEYLDPYAQKFGELSSISKRGDKLCGHAKDPISSGLALEEFVPKIIGKTIRKRVCLSWVRAEARSPCALTLCALNSQELSVGNRDRQPPKPRLDEIEAINKTLNPGSVKCSYYLTPEPGQNDKVMEEMGKGL